MKHFNEQIPGWFTFPTLYRDMVKKFPSGSTFVEIGTYKGKSFAYLAVEIFNSKKDITLIGIDGFGWDDVRPAFDEYMLPLKGTYQVIKGNSIDVGNKFPDKSIDFCFIDANHSYPDVLNDIRAYLPKMKEGGVIAGHDYCDDWPGVKQSVAEAFGNKAVINEEEVTWMVQL